MGNAVFNGAAQSNAEQKAFMDAFARVRLLEIIEGLAPGPPVAAAVAAVAELHPDWDNPDRLAESGIIVDQVDAACRQGRKYLHIDIAAARPEARKVFLVSSGLSDKQQRDIYPRLYGTGVVPAVEVASEVQHLNRHMDWLRRNMADPTLFPTYHSALGIHGRTQNSSGAVGAMGAAMTFISAIRELAPRAIIDVMGLPPPLHPNGRLAEPEDVLRWMRTPREPQVDVTLKAVLLNNGRALVFSSSKDANIFMNLGVAYPNAAAALGAYSAVKSNQALRHQRMHEFAVGEVKTATDPANLHERMGLASRETQTELRTDRFLMMALLTPEILAGGQAGRVMNNRDLTRFTHVFNLHHCWGWDGGRARNPDHWEYFLGCVRVWCGL